MVYLVFKTEKIFVPGVPWNTRDSIFHQLGLPPRGCWWIIESLLNFSFNVLSFLPKQKLCFRENIIPKNYQSTILFKHQRQLRPLSILSHMSGAALAILVCGCLGLASRGKLQLWPRSREWSKSATHVRRNINGGSVVFFLKNYDLSHKNLL